MAELRTLRDELAAAASTITRISQDLSAGLVKADEGAASLRTKVAELEAERSSMLLRLQALETRNTELCKLLERNQPDLTGAIRARDAALKKLHLMRDVVHDLIDERRAAGATGQAGRRHHSQQAGHGDSSASSGGESWGSLKLTDVESSMGEDNDDVARGAEEDSATVTGVTNDAVESSASAGKTSTDTGQRSALSNIVNQSDGLNSCDSRIAMTSSTRKSTVLTNSTKANILEATGRKPEERPVETSATSVAKEIKPGRRVANCGPSKVSKRDTKSGRVIKTITPVVSPSSGADSPSKITRDAPKTSPPEIGWYLEFKKPPATALRPLGPLTFQMLKDRLALDDDTMLRIESMESWQEPSLQMHIHRDMVFACHPIFLEGPTATYLVSWGSETVNANVKRYLTNGSERPGDAVFQLFVKTAGRDVWYYLGGHKLLASDVPSIWHTSNTQDKRELIEGLRERWTWLDAPNAEQVARRIETHELGQCSIELQSEGLQERSQVFVRQHFSSK